MKLKDYLLPEIEREIDKSRRALEQVPPDKYDWKPHEKSMAFGYLVNMVATIPTWIALQVNQDELDIAPADGGNMQQKRLNTSDEFLKALDESAASVRAAFQKTMEEHLQTNWRLLARGQVAARPDWESARRSVDFYSEGMLIWLEADTLIRKQTNRWMIFVARFMAAQAVRLK